MKEIVSLNTLYLQGVRVPVVPDVCCGLLCLDVHDAGGDGGAIYRRLPSTPVQNYFSGISMYSSTLRQFSFHA